MRRTLLLSSLLTSALAKPVTQGQESSRRLPGLQFDPHQSFSITIFEDLHFGEGNWAQCTDCQTYDNKSVNVINNILDWEPSDLVILNGDLLSGEAVSDDNYTQYIDQILEPLVQRKIPWASTYGNHDRSSKCTPRTILEYEKSYNTRVKQAWTESSVPGEDEKVGTSNYFIPVYSSDDASNLTMILWFFDSRAGGVYHQQDTQGHDLPMEDFVAPEIVSWFTTQRDSLNHQHNRTIPSLAFVHIPTHAAVQLQQIRDPATAPGINEEIVGAQANDADGDYNGKDTAFMNALVETEGLMAVFSGHDHLIDWCMKYPSTTQKPTTNLTLCFSRRTGYGGYSKTLLKGARKLVIAEPNLQVETWTRLENGNISGLVTLNETYGADRYAGVDAA